MTAEDGIRIKWAEYVDVMHDPHDLPLDVNVTLPRNWAITGDLESIDVSLKLSHTMAFMLDMVFARFTALTGKTIEEAHDRYALKVRTVNVTRTLRHCRRSDEPILWPWPPTLDSWSDSWTTYFMPISNSGTMITWPLRPGSTSS